MELVINKSSDFDKKHNNAKDYQVSLKISVNNNALLVFRGHGGLFNIDCSESELLKVKTEIDKFFLKLYRSPEKKNEL